jgi:uncharacterized membrane protein HdeD (DUF308 family)
MNTTESASTVRQARASRVFLIRGIIAIVWAGAFAAVAGSLTTGVTVGAGVLLVLYPLIDVVGSSLDARSEHGAGRGVLLTNAVTSTVAAVALGVAASAGLAEVLATFGVWAVVSGAAQLTVALRRRSRFGLQLPMVLAGGASVLLGFVFLLSAASANPTAWRIVIYAATGGADFVIQSWLLRRRMRRQAAPARPVLQVAA